MPVKSSNSFGKNNGKKEIKSLLRKSRGIALSMNHRFLHGDNLVNLPVNRCRRKQAFELCSIPATFCYLPESSNVEARRLKPRNTYFYYY